jgi:hypothetical protein
MSKNPTDKSKEVAELIAKVMVLESYIKKCEELLIKERVENLRLKKELEGGE